MPLPPLSEVAHVHGGSGGHRASFSTPRRPRLATAGAVTTLTAVAVAVTVTTVGGDDARTGSAQAASRVAASVPAATPVAVAPAAVAPAPAEDTSSLLARRSSRLDRADRSVRTVAVPRALYRAATTPSTVTVPAAIAAPPAAPAATTPAKPAPPAWVGPMGGPYRLTSRFGPRWGGVHHGLDFAAPIGTPLRSLSTGVVTDVKTGHGVYGTYIDVKFTDGSLARYAHLSRADVALGAKVGAGQTIGLSGNSGRSTGPHLHLEIHPHGDPNLKDAADPEIELRKRKVGV